MVTDFDFTADIVEVDGKPEAKVGREASDNDRLIRVNWELLERLDAEVQGA